MSVFAVHAMFGDAGPPVAVPQLDDGLYAVWKTARGEITARLFEKEAPLTVANFVGLAEATIPFQERAAGKPYFDGVTFHRVVPGFVVQGGDPLGNGEGGPGYEFADEFSPLRRHDSVGMLAMANAGPNTNGSQFYFTLAPVNRLNFRHTVFGRVVRGIEVLPLIQQGDVMERVVIQRVGAEAEAYHVTPEMFAALRAATPVIDARDPALPPLFENSAGLALGESYAGWLGERLHRYAVVRGITIRVRLLEKLTPPSVGEEPGRNPVRALHASLAGPDARAATLVYVANEKRWRLWLADGLLAELERSVATAEAGERAKLLHALKSTLLARAKGHMDAGEVRDSIDAATTDLIEALDRAVGESEKSEK